MARINVLPKNIADLIAAGEVVERPSSVIKEFIENSIDAGSRNITVEIQNGGKTYMRVTDDGCGIHRDDVRKAFLSHATSKISDVADLDAISTLGFRGEALASICAVSKVELMTRTSDDETGTRFVIEGGEEVLFDEAGSPVGTTILVRDIFYNIPARLKFLKKDVQEGNYIATIIERIALSNPHISFRFIRDGKVAFKTPGDGELKSAIYSVFGKEFTSQLIPVDSEHNGISVSGFVTKPTAGRGSRTMQTFFVNGRYVKSLIFMSALEQAYKNSIMVGKYPACVLFVSMPFETVDVNVHPAKTEVRFYDDKRVFEAVYNGALSAITADISRPQISFNTAKAFMSQADKGEQIRVNDIATNASTSPTEINTQSVSNVNIQPERSFIIKEFGNPITGSDNVLKSPEAKEEKVLDFLKDEYLKPEIKSIETHTHTPVAVAPVPSVEAEKEIKVSVTINNNTVENTTVIISDQKDVSVDSVSRVDVKPQIRFRYIGEVFNTYLMAELEDKMVLIDKHAAHERILFEQFKERGVGESQMMLSPVVITLSADEYSAVMDNIELLQNAGYDISDFGDRCVKLSACPPQLVDENLSDIILEIAGYLMNNIKTLMPEKLDWIYHSMACRSAVKAGNFTSSYEAERFVSRILNDESIRYCPHGRPVIVEMTRRELEKQFKRII